MEKRSGVIVMIVLTLVLASSPSHLLAQGGEHITVRVGAEIRTFNPRRLLVVNAPSIPNLAFEGYTFYGAYPILYMGKRVKRRNVLEYGCSISYTKNPLTRQFRENVSYSADMWLLGGGYQKLFRTSFYAESWRKTGVSWSNYGFGSELFVGTTRYDCAFRSSQFAPVHVNALWQHVALDYRAMIELRFGQEHQIGLMTFLSFHIGRQRLLSGRFNGQPIMELQPQAITFTGSNIGVVISYTWPEAE